MSMKSVCYTTNLRPQFLIGWGCVNFVSFIVRPTLAVSGRKVSNASLRLAEA